VKEIVLEPLESRVGDHVVRQGPISEKAGQRQKLPRFQILVRFTNGKGPSIAMSQSATDRA
jgi:hypothetical protein